jgi:hypothetical protein
VAPIPTATLLLLVLRLLPLLLALRLLPLLLPLRLLSLLLALLALRLLSLLLALGLLPLLPSLRLLPLSLLSSLGLLSLERTPPGSIRSLRPVRPLPIHRGSSRRRTRCPGVCRCPIDMRRLSVSRRRSSVGLFNVALDRVASCRFVVRFCRIVVSPRGFGVRSCGLRVSPRGFGVSRRFRS